MAPAGHAVAMRAGVALKNVPTAAWVCITVAFLGVLAALVTMAAIGADSTELSRFLNVAMNGAILLVGGAGTVYAGAAARTAQQAAEQTNGQLEGRIAAAVQAALDERGDADVVVDPGPGARGAARGVRPPLA